MAELEGFLCPLCKQDCLSVHDLETHYREAHDESSTSKFKRDFISFFENAFSLSSSSSPRPGRAAELSRSVSSGAGNAEEVPLTPVTNVSGISTEYWPSQEVGRVVVHSIVFRKVRSAHLADITVVTNRVVIRLEKFFRSLKEDAPKTAKEKRSMEQNMVPWKKDKEEKQCQGCGGMFGIRRRRHHCRLCGDIICKECSTFMSLQEAYPILSDCPDYESLAPPPPAPKKKFNFKVLRQDSNTGEEDDENLIRMCESCRKLVTRRLSKLGALENSPLQGLYERMKSTMDQSEEKKPGFVEVAKLIWTAEHGPPLQEATQQRQQLLRIYETIDAISKRILSASASDPSLRGQKLGRGIRTFASNYLQEHLLTLPSLPTQQKLAEMKEEREREAQERLQEIERQRQQEIILKAQREAEAATAEKSLSTDLTAEKISEGFGKFTSDLDRLFSRNTIKDLSKEIQAIIPGGAVKEEKKEEVEVGGWICNTDQVVTSMDEEDDPFMIQREQLLSFIAQARDAKRFDEMRALEESLKEIEAAMQEQKSYGFS